MPASVIRGECVEQEIKLWDVAEIQARGMEGPTGLGGIRKEGENLTHYKRNIDMI